MKPKYRNLLLSLGTALIATSTAQAQLKWDANNTGALQTDGAGDWLGANQWWDGLHNVDWTSGQNATFGYGGAGGAVTLAGGTTVGSLNLDFFTGTYTLGTAGAGNEITLNSGITKDSGIGHDQAGNLRSVATIISPVILGNAQTWLNNSSDLNAKAAAGSLNVSGGINLNGKALTIDGIGTTNLGGVTANIISGAGGITKNGTGVLILGGTGGSPINTYTGGTTINGGIVRFNAADTPGTSGSFGAGGITINNGIIEGYFGGGIGGAGASARSLGSGANQIQILGGTSGFSGQGATTTGFTIGVSGSTLKWGATGVNGATGFFNADVFVLQSSAVNANGKMQLNNGIDLNGATRTITSLGGDTTGGATVTGAIIDSMASGAALNKTGYGNLILQGNNTYTGATNVTGGSWVTSGTAVGQGGWLTLSGTNGALSATSAINLNAATLQMINTTAQTAVDRVNNANITVSNGGGITWNNASNATAVYAETLGSVSVSSGQFNTVLTNNQAGSQTLTLGGLSRSGSSALTFSAGGTGPQAAGGKNMIVVTDAGTTTGWTDGAASNSIIGAYATTGTAANAQTDYAVYNGNHVVAANTAGSTEDTWTNSAKAYTTSAGGTVTLTGTRTITALRNTGATTVLTLASGADLRTTGILNGAATVLTINPGTGGTLSSASGGDLYLTAGTGGITINAAVTNAGGTTNLVKSGSGNVTLTAADNNFGGNIVVNAGTLQIGSSTATQLSGGTYNGTIYIAAGAAFTMQSSSSNTLGGVISGDGNLNLMRNAITLGNLNTYTGKTTVGLSAAATSTAVTISKFNSVFTDVGLGTVHSASGSFGAPVTVANGTIDFGASIQNTATINYTGNGETTDRVINFIHNGSGTRVIDSSGGTNALLKFTSAAVSNGTNGSMTLQGSTNGEFVQGLGFGFNNLTKAGAGTWTLGGEVGVTGNTTISGGTLEVNRSGSLRGGSYGGTITFSNASVLKYNSTTDQSLNGLISGSGSLIKDNTSILTLSAGVTHTYNGTTSVDGGTLIVNGIISSSTTVASDATIGGTGTTGALTIQSGGFINPGNSPGILNVNGAYNQFGLYTAEIEGTVAGNGAGFHDQINVTGAVDITSGSLTTMFSTFTPVLNDLIFILLNDGIDGITGTYTGLAQGATVDTYGGFNWIISYNADSASNTWTGATDGNDIALMAVAIPEPNVAALLGALGMLALLRRRR